MNEIKYLNHIKSPDDVKEIPFKELPELAQEIRNVLIETVSNTGGHLASNLGVVELTIALHRVFDSPRDELVWDVGHQVYTHKLLTGRYDKFSSLRTEDGISGFSRPSESKHDMFYTGHSSTSISSAFGLSSAKTLKNDKNYVVAIIGDGALTGGLAYEALNNAGRSRDNLIVVLNDNEMSISKNVGSMARYLTRIRTKPAYFRLKAALEKSLNRIPLIGYTLSNLLFRFKSSIKRLIYGTTLFEDIGFRYMGPIDGHNLDTLCSALESAKMSGRPVLLHINTVKGKGYDFAERDPSQFHGVARFDINTGEPVMRSGDNFSDKFGEYLCEFAREDENIAAITAAMALGTGLKQFSEQFPKRFFDVGIAEEHAVTFAAGLTKNGILPVFAVYSTFLQRAYDELIHDGALQNKKMVIAIDRAGFVGNDGETHQGLFDVPMLNTIPRITVYAPSSYAELKHSLCNALYNEEGVVAIRYPRGAERALPEDFTSTFGTYAEYGQLDAKIVLVTYGRIFSDCCDTVNELREKHGINTRILKLNQIKPVGAEVIDRLMGAERIFFFEEGIRSGGVSEHMAAMLLARGYRGACEITAVDDTFVEQATVASQLAKYGLDRKRMVEKILRSCDT